MGFHLCITLLMEVGTYNFFEEEGCHCLHLHWKSYAFQSSEENKTNKT